MAARSTPCRRDRSGRPRSCDRPHGGAPARRADAARRQVDQPPGAHAGRARRGREHRRRPPATAPTSARPRRSSAASGRRSNDGEEHGRTVDYRIVSPGADGLVEPDGILDCGNSGTSLRLFAGAARGPADLRDPRRRRLVAQPSGRPYHRATAPMGAVLHARRNDSLPPLTVIGHTPLAAADIRTPVPSAQVKSAILLAGLRADGRTTVRETIATRDHTERMLRARGVPVEREPAAGERIETACHGASKEAGGCGRSTRRFPATSPPPPSGSSPGRDSSRRGADARARSASTRRVAPSIDILRAMGARIDEHPTTGPDDGVGEPRADLTVRSAELAAIDLGPDDVAAAIDEIPVLCLAATQARRHDGHPWRLRAAAQGIGPDRRHRRWPRRARGANRASTATTFAIHGGPTRLAGVTVASLDDHRLAMTFAVAGLVADGETRIERAGQRRGLLSRLLHRPRKGASMTKRVVLIGHPVAHSLSGAMQQAAFDTLGIDAKYELWDRRADPAAGCDRRAAGRRLPRRERHDPPQGAGRPARRPPDRGGPRDRCGQHDHPGRRRS